MPQRSLPQVPRRLWVSSTPPSGHTSPPADDSLASSPQAWEQVLPRHASLLRRAIERTYLGTGCPFTFLDVDDALQDLYCRLLDKDRRGALLVRGESELELKRYLQQMAFRFVVDRIRRLRAIKRGGAGSRTGGRTSGDSGGRIEELVFDAELSPEERLLMKERWRLLVRQCGKAANRQHRRRNLEILRLALIQGFTSREISQVLADHLSPSGVDTVLCRLRNRLESSGVSVPRRSPIGARDLPLPAGLRLRLVA